MTEASPLHLGDPALDEDHHELDALARRLLAAVAPEDRLGALDALRAHAERHFSAEDADLRILRDGNAQCHLDEHTNVLKSLDEVRELLAGDAQPEDVKERVARSLAVQLLDWLPHHVQEMDAAVATWRTKQRYGGAPVQIQRRAK